MKLIAQIRFGSEKQKIVRFGNFRYLVYILSAKEDSESMKEFITLMSKELTVPPSQFHYEAKRGDSYIFEVY
jgi:hypothetical protein